MTYLIPFASRLVARSVSPLRRSMNIEARTYISQGRAICGESRYYLTALDKVFTRPSLTKLEMHGRPRPTTRCDRMAWRGLWPPPRLELSRSLVLLATLAGERSSSASDGYFKARGVWDRTYREYERGACVLAGTSSDDARHSSILVG